MRPVRNYFLEQLTLNSKESGTFATLGTTRSDSETSLPTTHESSFPVIKNTPTTQIRIQAADEQITKIKTNKSQFKLSTKEFMVEGGAFLFGIREFSGSNPGPQTDCPAEFDSTSTQTLTLCSKLDSNTSLNISL